MRNSSTRSSNVTHKATLRSRRIAKLSWWTSFFFVKKTKKPTKNKSKKKKKKKTNSMPFSDRSKFSQSGKTVFNMIGRDRGIALAIAVKFINTGTITVAVLYFIF